MADTSPFESERIPKAADTRLAAAPLDLEIFTKFKQKLNPRYGKSHFSTTSDETTPPTNATRRPIYPVTLFVDLPEQPSPELLENLIMQFRILLLPSLPFLRHLPFGDEHDSGRPRKPTFLKLACAALGALASHDTKSSHWAASIWHTALLTHSASVEVDNSVARSVDWVLSWTLLATYGVSQADPDIWTKTNSWNGHVDTATRRMSMTQTHQYWPFATETEKPVSPSFIRSMQYFFIIDQLRALTFKTPASFKSSHLIVKLSTGHNFTDIYENLLSSKPLIVTMLSTEDRLLLLVGILSDIISCQQSLGCMFETNIQDLSKSRTLSVSADIVNKSRQRSSYDSDRVVQYINPYLAHSAAARYFEIQAKLTFGLDRWEIDILHANIVDEPWPEKMIQLSMKEIAIFCRILLSGGPEILNLSSKIGFNPKDNFERPSDLDDSDLPHISNATLELAWKTLDACEASNELIERLQPEALGSVWSPIICFTAGLVVWVAMRQDCKDKEPQEWQRTKHVLRSFELQLKQMRWSNAATMLEFIRSLRAAI